MKLCSYQRLQHMQLRIILEARTLHFLYGIPVDEHNPFLISMVHPKSDHAKLLLAARCHIIDEISVLHFKAFDCADQLMRSLLRDVIEFGGGHMLITVGDFHQVGHFSATHLALRFP